MSIEDSFTDFDPFNEELPDYNGLSTTGFEARHRLEHRTSEEVISMAHTIGKIMLAFDPPFEKDTLDELKIEPIEFSGPDEYYYYQHLMLIRASYSRILFEYKEEINLTKYTHLEKINWEEIFSTLALCAISYALRTKKEILEDEPIPSKYDNRLHNFAAHISEANESILYAKLVSKNKQTEDKIKLALSQRNRIAANVKHAPAKELKEGYCDFAAGNPNLSRAESARRYYRELSESQKEILCPSRIEANAVRTLTEYLRKNG